MTYFKDLSDYTFLGRQSGRPAAKNIGWLENGHAFDQEAPSQDVLELLWEHCKISTIQTRGIHECDLCSPRKTVYASRDGLTVLLGTSEIRVFLGTRIVYAAPTLLYHYVRTHHYKPPDQFLVALVEGPRAGSEAYVEAMKDAGLEWKTAANTKVATERSKFEKFDGEMRKVTIPSAYFIDGD